jgi:transcriptional regulator with XRE-family HTH domain
MGNATTPAARAPSSETIRVNIIVGRVRARLSQEHLAERSGVGRATISRIERGAANDIGVKTLERLASALGVRIARHGSWPSVQVARRYLRHGSQRLGEVVAPR